MPKFNGSLLKILVGTVAINNLTSCELTIDGETIDVTTKDSAGWVEKIHGMKSWSMKGSGILDYAANEGPDEIFDDLVNGATATFRYSSATTGHSQFVGTGLYNNLGINAEMEDKVTFSFSIDGSGPITRTTI